MKHHIAAWLLVMVVAVLNGTLRQAVYGRWLPEASAHAVSTFTLLALMAGVTAGLHQWKPLPSGSSAWGVGLVWIAATVLFEFGLGRLGSRMSWEQLLSQYDVRTGSLWVFVPLACLLFPPLFRYLSLR